MESYFEEEHELDLLEDLFEELSIDGPTRDQMYQLYGVFLKDIVKSPIVIDGIEVLHDKSNSKHYLFKNKPKGFEHLCTRESKYSGNRQFDPERANKIHWIKKVIVHANNNRIKYFERLHSNGQNQFFYWFMDKDYVVIIRVITPHLQLITAFRVDELNKRRYYNWYQKYKK